MPPDISRPYYGFPDCLEIGTRARARLARLERAAYGLEGRGAAGRDLDAGEGALEGDLGPGDVYGRVGFL